MIFIKNQFLKIFIFEINGHMIIIFVNHCAKSKNLKNLF